MIIYYDVYALKKLRLSIINIVKDHLLDSLIN